MLFEKQLRKLAYHMISVKDGLHGIMRHKKEFENCIKNDNDVLREISLQKLKQILLHAYKTSPYYRELWRKIGFQPQDIKSFDDINNLPFLTKDIIQKNKDKLISQVFDRGNLNISYTGGTSGTHTSFYQNSECTSIRIGRQWGILGLCGYNIGDRNGLIWGAHEDLSGSDNKKSLKKMFRDFAGGKEILCCTVMSPDKMMKYYARLNKFKPDILYGYPNAMAQFATFVKEKKLKPITVKKIICTAERLTEDQREVLAEVFNGEVYNLYCTREHGCIGFECYNHDGFHIDIGSVYLEIVSAGNSVKPGNTGEIVITDLLNYGMPFIRNKIGDRGGLIAGQCSCGCPLPLLGKFDGRITDILYRPDGSSVSGVMLVDMFMDVSEIEAMQIVQDNINEVNLIIVVTDNYNMDIEKKSVKEMREYMGNEIKINVKIVSEIPRNPVSGKFQEVINNMQI